MQAIKPKEKQVISINGDRKLLDSVGVARSFGAQGRDLQVQPVVKGLAVVNRGMNHGVAKGEQLVLDIKFESIVILQNGWMVACKHGVYYLYDENGNIYKGLSFLNKQNAIRFANSL